MNINEAATTNPVASALLAKFKMDTEVRNKMEPGVYKDNTGDGHRLRYHVIVEAESVRVAEDIPSAKIAAAVPYQKIAMLALSKLNEASMEKVIREAMTMQGLPEEMETMVKEKAATLARELIPTRPRKGAVTVKGLTFELVPSGVEFVGLPLTTGVAKTAV